MVAPTAFSATTRAPTGVLPQPEARRLRAPSWRDSRLLIGLVLLLASVALGARAVSAADRTVPVYAARVALPADTVLAADQVLVVRVRFVGTDAAYLDARRPFPAGAVLSRTVGAGELIPRGAVAPAAMRGLRAVSLPIEGALPTGITTGSRVDVWVSARRRDGAGTGYDAPRQVARSVEVVRVDRPGTGLTAGRVTAVHLLMPEAELPTVLDALANDARTAVLPIPGERTGPTAEVR
jgi:hypothetical protein